MAIDSVALYTGRRRAQPVKPDIRARYDAASDSVEFQNYWANVDAYDADSANSKGVRQKLVKRSRYEAGSNGYADGIAQTHANFLVGLGPTLSVKTADRALNQRINAEWRKWSKAIQLRRKLWTAAHAKLVDGESFGIATANPSVDHPVKLDVVMIECDQVTTPYVPYRREGVIDGVTFDQYGNPLVYDILPQHPGSQWAVYWQDPKPVAARYVLHWFHCRRPQQHRGVPECKSTMQVGASSRRWREATVSAAETAASFAALLYTEMPPGDAEPVAPFSTLEIERRMMAALPMGYKAEQMQAQHPNASYDSFNRAQIAELARPKNMPYNMAACDSSQSNYASGRLDFQPYFTGVDIERADCEDCVLDKLFRQWWREAALVFGFGDPRDVPEHQWDWPNHPVADVGTEASATNVKLRNGTLTLRQVYADAGDDYDEAVETMARDYGVSVEKIKETLLLANFNATNQIGSIAQADVQRDVAQTNAQSRAATQKPSQQPQAVEACDCESMPASIQAGECTKWITYGTGTDDEGNRTGGRKMCLDSDGNIAKGGPKSMSGKPFSKLGQLFKKINNNPAAHQARFERTVKQNAQEFGMTSEQYKEIGDELWNEELGRHREREKAKQYARKVIGITQADIDRWENAGLDYTSRQEKLRGFDEYASMVAQQFPELGIDPNDAEAEVWDLVKEGVTPPPSKNSDEYHRKIAEFVSTMQRSGNRQRTPEEEAERQRWQDVEFGHPDNPQDIKGKSE